MYIGGEYDPVMIATWGSQMFRVTYYFSNRLNGILTETLSAQYVFEFNFQLFFFFIYSN